MSDLEPQLRLLLVSHLRRELSESRSRLYIIFHGHAGTLERNKQREHGDEAGEDHFLRDNVIGE